MNDYTTNTPGYGPDNPHPLSRMKTELVWEGKYDAYGNRRPVRLPTSPPPLQRIEAIGKPHNSEKAHHGDVYNMLIWGDNKLALVALLEQFRGKVDLIYIDPPFAVGANFTMEVQIGEDGSAIEQEQSILETVAYRDTWGRSTDSYLHMMYERLALMHALLHERGSMYVHVGPNSSHYIKALLDELFSPGMYRSEIIWRRSNSHNKLTDQYGPIHDVILFYTKSEDFVFHPGTTPFTKGYIEERFKYRDARGVYQPNYLTGPGTRKGDSGKPWRGFDPTKKGRHWAIPARLIQFLDIDTAGLCTQAILDRLYEADLLVIPKKAGGQPMYKQYLTGGSPYQDVWAYQPNTKGVLYGTERNIDEDVKWLEQEDEKVKYTTQKPEGLISRILSTSSNEGDLVLDCFCGSGTTLAAAEKLGRRWIGIDLGRSAVHTTRKRLIQVQRELHSSGRPYRSFDVYNLGVHERQWWRSDRLKGCDQEYRDLVLRFYKAASFGSSANGGQPGQDVPHPLLHGTRQGALVHIAPSDDSFSFDELRAVAEAALAAGGRELHCLAWEFEMELALKKAAVEAETGLIIRLKHIPREIMEPNRTAAQFFEAGYLEARALKHGPKVDVALARFMPALAEAPEQAMAALRERAITSPFDFIDFWAVDFTWQAGKPFEHHWQDFRTRKDRSLKTRTEIGWTYDQEGLHTICVKVIDVFGVETTAVIEVCM